MKKSALLWILVILAISGLYAQKPSVTVFNKADLVQCVRVTAAPDEKSLNQELKSGLNIKNKSIGKAVLLSAILPGLGENYLGNHKMGKFLMGFDAGLWSGLWGANHFEHNKIDDSRNLARQQAGIGIGDYDEQYWIQVGKYLDIYENNEMELINRNIENVYENTDRFYWNWKSDDSRIKYKNLRSEANSLSKLGNALVLGLVVNRLASMLNVIRLGKIKEKDPVKNLGVDWKLKYKYSASKGTYVGINFLKSW